MIAPMTIAISAGSSDTLGVLILDAKRGVRQFVPLRDGGLIGLLTAMKKRVLSSDRVFPPNANAFRLTFELARFTIGGENLGFVPPSLRHGGATHDYVQSVSMDDIQGIGRYVSSISCNR